MTTPRYRVARLALVVTLAGLGALGAVGLPTQPSAYTLVSTIHGASDLVEVADGRMYVTAEQTLTVFDISDPESPQRAGSYTFPEKIWGFEVVDSLIYAAVDFFGLGVLDVTNADAPTLRASFKTPGQAKGVGVYGTKALVADHVEGVDLIDLSNPAEPSLFGSFYLDGYARDVAAFGRLAFAVDAPTGVYVFDLSAANPLEPISTVQSATAPSSVEAPAASGPDGPEVICMVGGGFLQVYDVSNPLAPERIAEFPTPGGRPRRVTVRGRFAYVADGHAGLQVVDLATPSAPVIVGAYATESPARDVAVSDTHVFVVVGEQEGDEEGGVLVLRRTS